MRYDLHTHTKYSPCSNIEPKRILKQAAANGLAGIAVTDHNTIKGALASVKLAKKNPGVKVIVGEEIMTDRGEVLGYFLTEEIAPGRFSDVVDKIREQGGIASISHPYSVGIIRKSALSAADNTVAGMIAESIDAVETFNARTGSSANRKSKLFAERYKLGQTGGSDAHFAWEIGRGWTDFSGDLVKAIRVRRTRTGGTNKLMHFARLTSTYPKIKNKIIR